MTLLLPYLEHPENGNDPYYDLATDGPLPVPVWMADFRQQNVGSDVLFDMSGYGNHGAITGATWGGSSKGVPLVFGGDPHYVDLGTPEELNTAAQSVALWVKAAGDTDRRDIIMRSNTSVGSFNIRKERTTNKWRLIVRSADAPSTAVIIESDSAASTKWTHLLASCDGINCCLYVNGVKQSDTETISGGLDTTNYASYEIGRHSLPANFFDGELLDVVVWDYGVTEMEAASYYASVFNGGPGLLGRSWPRSFPSAGAAEEEGLSIPIAMHHYKQMMGVN